MNPRPPLAVEVVSDIVDQSADTIARVIESATGNGRPFTLAVSGGRTPWAVLGRLGQRQDLAWSQVGIWQVDERVAPKGHQDRNLTSLMGSLGPQAATIYPMPVDEDDLEAAADRYATSLPSRFDLVLLGLGPDGHTASLVPGDDVLQVTDRDVAVTAPYQGRQRMTLTYPALGRANSIIWLVFGADKKSALEGLVAGDPTLPASGISTPNALVLTDLALDV